MKGFRIRHIIYYMLTRWKSLDAGITMNIQLCYNDHNSLNRFPADKHKKE